MGMVGASDRSGARTLFEDARQASWELYRHDVRYGSMEVRALALGGGLPVPSSHAGKADRMGAVDAYVDYESMMERQVAEWCAKVDAAAAVLYGRDWTHGIARSLGFGYAEILDYIYIQRLSINETARRARFARATVCRMRSRAFAYMDAVGLEAAARGE